MKSQQPRNNLAFVRFVLFFRAFVAGYGMFLQVSLVLSGACTAAYAQSPDISGSWRGELDVGLQKLPLHFHFQQADSLWQGSMDSPQQNARGIPLSEVQVNGPLLYLEIEAIRGSYEGVLLGTSIQGTFRQAGMEFPLILTPFEGEEAATLFRPQTPTGRFPYEILHTGFVNEEAGILLQGTLTIPPGPGPFPGLVLVSGSGPQNRNGEVFSHQPFWVLADYLTRKGIIVLRYDDRGVGASEGDFEQATTADFAGDAWAGLERIKRLEKIDTLHLGVVGHSEGGLIAWMMAAEQRKDLAFIAALAPPVVSIDTLMAQQTYDLVRGSGASEELAREQTKINRQLYRAIKEAPDPDAAREALLPLIEKHFVSAADSSAREKEKERLWQQYAPMTSGWFFQFIKMEPQRYIEKIRIPTWVAFGEKDRQVNASLNGEALEDMQLKGVEIHHFESLNHLFQKAPTGAVSEYGSLEETFHEPVMENLADWINRQTSPGP
jgi:pimeloyl-ACP methyl ester carboxylesterase